MKKYTLLLCLAIPFLMGGCTCFRPDRKPEIGRIYPAPQWQTARVDGLVYADFNWINPKGETVHVLGFNETLRWDWVLAGGGDEGHTLISENCVDFSNTRLQDRLAHRLAKSGIVGEIKEESPVRIEARFANFREGEIGFLRGVHNTILGVGLLLPGFIGMPILNRIQGDVELRVFENDALIQTATGSISMVWHLHTVPLPIDMFVQPKEIALNEAVLVAIDDAVCQLANQLEKTHGKTIFH